jgi:hypothetical protein
MRDVNGEIIYTIIITMSETKWRKSRELEKHKKEENLEETFVAEKDETNDIKLKLERIRK